MLAKQSGSKSGQLIDFEQARSALSRQHQLNSRQQALSDLEATIIRQLSSERTPLQPPQIQLNESVDLILATIHDLEKRLQETDRNVETPARHASEDFRRELRWLESRLDDIDARIAALAMPTAQKIVISESVLRARTWAREASVFEPLSPFRPMDTPALLPLDKPPKECLNNAARNGIAAPAFDRPGSSGASTAMVLEALLNRPYRRETLYLLLDCVTHFWPALLPGLQRPHSISASSLTPPAANVDGAEIDAMPANRRQDVTFGAKAKIAPLTLSTQLGALVRIAMFVALACLALWIGFGKTEKANIPALPGADPHGRSANSEVMRGGKTTPQNLRTELKVNSLKTKVSLLSPEPISGNSKLPRGELRPPSSDDAKKSKVANASSSNDSADPEREPNDPPAVKNLGEAADQFDYATRLYQSGDSSGALSWLEKSASKGYVKAQLQLGVLYLKGRDVPRNLTLARKWLEMAADNGDPDAMHNLAVLYSGGEGRKPDYARASDLFRRAAEQGVVDSMFNLGLAYEDGLGVERDMIQAWAWFAVAAAQGDSKAAQKRKKLDKFLDREELYEARLLADSLKLARRNR